MAVIEPSTIQAMPSATAKTRRWPRRLAYVAIALVVLIAGAFGGAWYYSGQLINVAPDSPSYTIKVLALHPGTVELASTSSTRRNGARYGLDWPKGRVVLGPIVSVTQHSVIRRIIGSTNGLKAGTMADLDVSPYNSPADVRLPYRSVMVPDPLGPMPAWYIPGQRSTWVVLVHGWTANRADGLRYASVLARFRLPILDITYRNDRGAPASPDHLYHLGDSEWQDVQAAVQYARGHGARSIILYGISMGGTVSESFLQHSPDAKRVRAVVLDSPPLDWSALVDWHADQSSLPGPIKAIELPLIKEIIAWRIGLWSLDSLNLIKSAGSLRTPTLLFQGTRDTTVPYSTSTAFARARPDLVTYYLVPGAEHTQSWNLNPTLYQSRLSAFLTRVLR